MIAVLADDLTGAAEVGGVALRCGLSAEVQTAVALSPASVLCLDTATRACPPDQAAARLAQPAAALRAQGRRLFKKVDSVLRGPVAAELGALLSASQPRALLVPANPGRGRIVRAGCYYVDGRRLADTEFANDPDHPARTSDVRALLDPPPDLPLATLAPGETMPERGLVVGDAAAPTDLEHWAGRVGPDVLPAGAAEFFEAWLAAQGHVPRREASDLGWRCGHGARHLFVSGSTSPSSRAFVAHWQALGKPVFALPAALRADAVPTAALLEAWSDGAANALASSGAVVLTIGGALRPEAGWPARLVRWLAQAAAGFLARQTVDCLWVEGGATAQALLSCLGWQCLPITGELAPGVVALRSPGPAMVVKPGSYAWPADLLDL
jgi:uncharacterized protein YgbK (DUF1537 family)